MKQHLCRLYFTFLHTVYDILEEEYNSARLLNSTGDISLKINQKNLIYNEKLSFQTKTG